jgi:hypothetical protein
VVVTRQQDSAVPEVTPDLVTPELVTPGITVGDGRYRLLERVGGDERVQAGFWRARDAVLDRDVALTTLTGPDGARSVQAALAAARLEQPGIARVLDVLSDGRQLGPGLSALIVTEWVPGADLATLATEATRSGRTLPPTVIARALAPVAAAVDVAHRAGVTLGCDHPQRIRVGNDGLARIAFPVVSASGRPTDDLRGIGAGLYLLLTGRWPLPDPPAGLYAAPASSTGVALPPQSLRPGASSTLSTLAERCLAGASANGVYTGAAVHQLLEQVTNAEADTMLLGPMPNAGVLGQQPQRPTWTSDDYDGSGDDQEAAELARRRKLAISLGVLGLAVLLLFGWVAQQLMGFLSDDTGSGAPTLVVPKPGGPSGQSGQPGEPEPPAPAGPIQAAGVQVFNVEGDPDNPNRVSRAVDGNPQSSWKTFDYAQPFPALKDGVGVLVSFAESVSLAAVQVDSPSAGSTIEIRTAPSGDAGLAGSTVLGSATLTAGRTEIQLQSAPASQRVLVWITGLSTASGKNATEFSELTFLRAG